MIYVIEFVALVIVLLGFALLFRPHRVINLIFENLDSWGLYLVAIVVRLLMGAALISVAARSDFPVILEIFGGLSILGAIALIVMGRARMTRLIKWGFGLPSPNTRMGGFFAILLGGFLIYALT